MTNTRKVNGKAIRLVLLLYAGIGVSWAGSLFAPSLLDKCSQVPNVAEESAVVLDAERLWIESLKWDGPKLHLVCCREYVGTDGFGYVPGKPWVYCYCLFWDDRGVKLPYEADVCHMHEIEVLRGVQKKESILMSVEVPRGASKVSLKYGNGNWQTRKVRLPLLRVWWRSLLGFLR
jgi:hypothetical protein